MSTPDYEKLSEQIEAADLKPWSKEAKEGIAADLNFTQQCELWSVWGARAIRRQIEALETTPAIRARLTAEVDRTSQGMRIEVRDLSFLAERSRTTTSQFGRTRQPYAPEPGCHLRMRLSEALHFRSEQQPYSDNSFYLVPVDGDVSAVDTAVCQRNLSNFVRYADTHTGFSGSGANWTARLHVVDGSACVEIECRASICE